MKRYVNGLYFSQDLAQVLFRRKVRPEWQAGQLNGVGGSIEADESPLQAMNREFEEETGIYDIHQPFWELFLIENLSSKDGGQPSSVHWYFGIGELEKMVKAEAWVDGSGETNHVIPVDRLAWHGHPMPSVIPNLRYMVPMARVLSTTPKTHWPMSWEIK